VTENARLPSVELVRGRVMDSDFVKLLDEGLDLPTERETSLRVWSIGL